MQISDLTKPIIYNFEKNKCFKIRNNVAADQLRDLRNYFRVQNNILRENTPKRKLVNDTGFYFLDNMYFRNATVRKIIDTIGNTPSFIQKKIRSRYNALGKLEHRSIEKSLKYEDGIDFYYTLSKSVDVTYQKNQPAIIITNGRLNGKDFEKIMQKGKPSTIITYEQKRDALNGAYKVVSEKTNFAHLNKSPLKSMETLFNEYETTQTKKMLKKVVEFKDGTKLQTGEHNGQPLLVKIPSAKDTSLKPDERKVKIFKTRKDIDQVLEKYGKEVKDFLS